MVNIQKLREKYGTREIIFEKADEYDKQGVLMSCIDSSKENEFEDAVEQISLEQNYYIYLRHPHVVYIRDSEIKDETLDLFSEPQ